MGGITADSQRSILCGLRMDEVASPLLVFWGVFFCFVLSFVFVFFWPPRAAHGMLVPRPGIELVPPAVEAQSPNHWTAREVPPLLLDSHAPS